jgi:transaldolase
MKPPETFGIKLFVDAADLENVSALKSNDLVKGFTTNPTLMRNAGVKDYIKFAKSIVSVAWPLQVSLEVISDDIQEMEQQALLLQKLGENVVVKIPITNTKGQSCIPLVARLSREGISVNVTAIMTKSQIDDSIDALSDSRYGIVSIFAGRIADSGNNPEEYISYAISRLKSENVEILWASPREIFNLVQAENLGCHIITMTPDLWKKLPLIGKDLKQYSLETVEMFYKDASSAGYEIKQNT